MTESKAVKRSAIEHVIYRMPLDGAQESGQFDPRMFEKTTYDPELISDERYIELGREAAVDAKRRGELQREWAGEASNGLGFYGYIDDQQRVSYLCARMPRASAHAPALRVQLSDDLFPAQAFFNAVPDSSFVAMVEQLSRGVGHVVNAAGCSFVEEGPEPRRVEFWALNDEIRLSVEHFRELLRQVCDSQCQQVPEQADQLNALVRVKGIEPTGELLYLRLRAGFPTMFRIGDSVRMARARREQPTGRPHHRRPRSFPPTAQSGLDA